jgi:hypothetical protein
MQTDSGSPPLGVRARTAFALGLLNIGRISLYRWGLRTGLHPVVRLHAALPSSPCFRMPGSPRPSLPRSAAWEKEVRYFGWWPLAVDEAPPDWHLNPMAGLRVANPEREWWRIADFDPRVGDIKAIWEASRFDWVLAFAQRACAGDAESLERLNRWLGDWCRKNPAYQGPNWKCGQEASIRAMHLAVAALILGQVSEPEESLLALMEAHLRRILPTVSYAIAQDNNHGVSEGGALFIGGSWLAARGRREADRWESQGRRLLENRIRRLIEPDGSFSQYSLNYHRLLLDTLCIVEVWRRFLGRPAFSLEFESRARAASEWLRAWIDPAGGDGPNLGGNDGTRLFPLTGTDYRDFRPSVQLASALLTGRRAYEDDGDWNLPLRWLDVPPPEVVAEPSSSRVFDHGGFALLRRKDALAMLRYPRFRFRPAHADALHVDLWVRGINHLRDAGTYSYNTEQNWLDYFPGTAGHNTVQFDGRDQMPRLSRFLFGDWLQGRVVKPLAESPDGVEFGAGYADGQGADHARTLSLRHGDLVVRDDIRGFARQAILRWRLKPGPWRVEGQKVTDGQNMLTVQAGMPIRRFDLVTGWESRYYGKKEEVPVLEVEVGEAGTLTTNYTWSS